MPYKDKEKARKASSASYHKNKERVKSIKTAEQIAIEKSKKTEYDRDYRLKNKEKLQTKSRIWKQKHPEVQKRWAENNKEKLSDYGKNYRLAHPGEKQAYNRKWISENKERDRSTKRAYEKNKLSTDPEYLITRRLRMRFREALRRHIGGAESKKTSVVKLLGCSLFEFKMYIESKFVDGMSWDNNGKWHLDHIRPCASFDLTDPHQQAQCFYYTNMQPLWAVDNIRKGAKYEATA